MGEQLELLGPGLRGVEVAVDLGERGVKDQVLELLLVADVAVEQPPLGETEGSAGEP
jgi:hypothetical protein